jgi:RsiW-degrading membrane proteinase PrsW (M82 family)
MNQLTVQWVEAGQRYSRTISDQQPSKNPGTIRIGRDPAKCDLLISDPTVSGLHVEIFFDPTSQLPYLRNLRESNPPLVDNQQLVQGEIPLQQGSVIRLGQVTLTVSQIQSSLVAGTQGLPATQNVAGQIPLLRSSGEYNATPLPTDQEAFASLPPTQESVSEVSLSQLIPIVSTGKDLTKKGNLIPGIVTVILVVLLFTAVGVPVLFNLLMALGLGLGAFYYIYRLCGKYKPWWILLAAGFVTVILLIIPPFFQIFVLVFRLILPGRITDEPVGLISTFIRFFFGAGLLEELLKAVPVFGALWLGLKVKSPLQEKIGVWEPLDGILLASASALAFTLIETLGEYVPGIVMDVSSEFGEGAGELLGLHLLIPRVLGSIAGHMAYSGYFGYFIGLSVMKPRQRWRILFIGYITSSLLHALWNTMGSTNYFLLVLVGVASYAFLVAAILKARQLSPTRSENFVTGIPSS